MVSAIKSSTELELDPLSNERFRRIGNKEMPELKMLAKKTNREEGGDEKGNNEEREKEKSFDPIILSVKADKTVDFNWKKIQDEFKSLNPGVNIVYLRFSGDSGHIGIYKYSNQEIKYTEKLEIEGVNFTIEKCAGEELINFWKDHGGHFEMCISKNKKFVADKLKRGKQRDVNALKVSVNLGDET